MRGIYQKYICYGHNYLPEGTLFRTDSANFNFSQYFIINMSNDSWHSYGIWLICQGQFSFHIWWSHRCAGFKALQCTSVHTLLLITSTYSTVHFVSYYVKMYTLCHINRSWLLKKFDIPTICSWGEKWLKH